ncbi:hypothetical protein BJV78DRAFT_1133294 [Lactifluus subvellereus]|nr:hypothetical protein BJV78DRAFT_1133294 [Lactifluus subvellereus]
MPSPPSISTGVVPGKTHPDYFYPEGDVTFRVENILFRVHKHFFIRESPYFRSLFAAAPIPCQDPPGSSATNPVVLNDITSDGFAGLLWVFYNPQYPIYDATVEKWKAILVLAQRWAFKEVEKLGVRELENLTIPPADKIFLYQYLKLDKSLLVDSYLELVVRSKPLGIDEGLKLGLKTALQIARAREVFHGSDLGRGPVSPSVNLRDMELYILIPDVFG